MSAVESRLAAIIAEHRVGYDLVDETLCCDCGDRWTLGSTEALRAAEDAHIRHVAAVIASSDDLAVIELPAGVAATDIYDEPITDYLNVGRTQVYVARSGMWPVGEPYTGGYHVQTMTGAAGQHSTPDGAERYAAALIAAARAARARNELNGAAGA